jgi:Ca-activated chloride channel family protein
MWMLHSPWALLLLVVPAWILYEQRRRKTHYAFSLGTSLVKIPPTPRVRLKQILPFVWAAGMVLLTVALARPRSGVTYEEYLTKGVDIVLTLDCSGSMLSEDFKPNNRLHVAKAVVKEFVQSRPNDRLGLVVFAGQAFTQCPLTLDHGILLTFLDKVEVGLIEDALAISVDRLTKSDAKSKVIVLLTDGQNNRGEVDPLTAAAIAQTFGIKVYTIGVGTKGYAMMPVDDPVFGKRYMQVQVNIDEDVLTKIAQKTGGRYFRATDPEKLKEIYATIGSLEKSEVKTRQQTSWNDHYRWFLVPGLLILLGAVLADLTFLRSLP